MRTDTFWLWRTPDPRRPGRLRVTAWRMTESEALARWPGAVRVEGSAELREVPETEADRQAVATSSWVRR